MNHIKFESKSISVYFLTEDETTEDILYLCEQMKSGNATCVNGRIYHYNDLPEFLVVVYKMQHVDFTDVYNRNEEDLMEIWANRAEARKTLQR